VVFIGCHDNDTMFDQVWVGKGAGRGGSDSLWCFEERGTDACHSIAKHRSTMAVAIYVVCHVTEQCGCVLICCL
jgi:hypothetical protein